MENPATWGRAEHVIKDAMRQAAQERERGMVGLSEVRVIADALRRAGLLKEER